MITNLPSVQKSCGRVRQYVCCSDKFIADQKRVANRRHRRKLNRVTRRMQHDVETWFGEDFGAPSLSSWDLD